MTLSITTCLLDCLPLAFSHSMIAVELDRNRMVLIRVPLEILKVLSDLPSLRLLIHHLFLFEL